MTMAEISILPVGTKSTSVSFYVARALESVDDTKDLKCHLNAMGTILEAKDTKTVLDAAETMISTLHNLGVDRVSAVLKIDSRLDKQDTVTDKVKAVRRHLDL